VSRCDQGQKRRVVVDCKALSVGHWSDGQPRIAMRPRLLHERDSGGIAARGCNGTRAADMVGVRVRDEYGRDGGAVAVGGERALEQGDIVGPASVARVDEHAPRAAPDHIGIGARPGEEARVETTHAHNARREALGVSQAHAVER